MARTLTAFWNGTKAGERKTARLYTCAVVAVDRAGNPLGVVSWHQGKANGAKGFLTQTKGMTDNAGRDREAANLRAEAATITHEGSRRWNLERADYLEKLGGYVLTDDVRARETKAADPAKAAAQSAAAKRAAVTRRWNVEAREFQRPNSWTRGRVLEEAYREQAARELEDLAAAKPADAELLARLAGVVRDQPRAERMAWNAAHEYQRRPGSGHPTPANTTRAVLEAWEAVHEQALVENQAADAIRRGIAQGRAERAQDEVEQAHGEALVAADALEQLLQQAEATLVAVGYVEPVVQLGILTLVGNDSGEQLLLRLEEAYQQRQEVAWQAQAKLDSRLEAQGHEEALRADAALDWAQGRPAKTEQQLADSACYRLPRHPVHPNNPEGRLAEYRELHEAALQENVRRWAQERLAESKAEREEKAEARLDTELEAAAAAGDPLARFMVRGRNAQAAVDDAVAKARREDG